MKSSENLINDKVTVVAIWKQSENNMKFYIEKQLAS
mgnify:CR=1 FL=1